MNELMRNGSSPLTTARPVLRWAGGKRALLGAMRPMIPANYERYVEPMLGGGALFFAMQPARALLSDINSDLIGFYRALRDNPEALVRALLEIGASRSTYYEMRAMHPVDPIEAATRFAYLNRLAWNGLYRVNRDGRFNVPIGDRLPKQMWDVVRLEEASQALSGAQLLAGDVKDSLSHVTDGDFVFIDPPYPRANGSGFNRYSRTVFEMSDHRELAAKIGKLTRSFDIQVLLAVGDKQDLIELYKQELGGSVRHVDALCRIAGTSEARRRTTEVFLTNYRILT